MGVSQIIYSNNLLGFPDFPTGNRTVFSIPTAGTNWTVPNGVQWIGAKIWGAGGNKANTGAFQQTNNGGAGCYAEILMQVYSGEILQIRVGESGRNDSNSAINGGGIGGGNSERAGGGGGYSGIFTNNRPIVIVGGGGGAGFSANSSGRAGGSGSDGEIAVSQISLGTAQGGVVSSMNSYSGGNGATGSGGSVVYGGGGGGGGFRGGGGGGRGSGAAFGNSAEPFGGGGGGTACAILRDNYVGLFPRKLRPIFVFSNSSPNPNGYQGYGNGATQFTNPGNGRIEITY